MAKWMDLTNSLVTWKGGTVGIVRVELELARALRQQEEINYCIYKDGAFRDVTLEAKKIIGAENPCEVYNQMQRGEENIGCEETNRNKNEKLKEVFAFSTSRLERMKRGYLLSLDGKKPVYYMLVRWTYRVVSSIAAFCHKKHSDDREGILANKDALKGKITHPFLDGDCLFSCGWYTSGKENALSEIKKEIPNFKIAYMVYDLVLLKEETAMFYSEYDAFKDYYLQWISKNCDYIFYWGKTAQIDTENLFHKENWRCPKGKPAFCCSKISHASTLSMMEEKEILQRIGIRGKYILMVGSVEPKKNYDVIYRAYCIISRMNLDYDIPQCVIVGGNYGSCKDLINSMKNDPKVREYFLFIRATDVELDILYKYTDFTLLPSFYEGWSIVLAEMLNYGKMCIASDVAPLREVGGDLAVYVNPYDAKQWATLIVEFTKKHELVKEYEDKIICSWNPPGWSDAAKTILDGINEMKRQGTVYFDFTLGFAYSFVEKPGLTGIPRTVLMLAKYMYSCLPNIKYFALTDVGYINIEYEDIQAIIEGNSLDNDFATSSEKLRQKTVAIPTRIIERERQTRKSLGEKNEAESFVLTKQQEAWLYIASAFPDKIRDRIIEKKHIFQENNKESDYYSDMIVYDIDLPFSEGDIVISVGPGLQEWINECIIRQKRDKKFKVIQTIYDLSPVLFPHTHLQKTIDDFVNCFLKKVFYASDYMIYGGKTAMHDSEKYIEKSQFPVPKGIPVKWGNDLNTTEVSEERLEAILEYYGIENPYILEIGTIQRRKNQELIYHAMLLLKEKYPKMKISLVIAGYPGWGYSEFLTTLQQDKRINDSIIVITPSDEELNALYRNCLFTVLPSLYEGWSLTLPESLSYGKFCIAADCEPLVEIGEDLIEYADPYDAVEWAEKIASYVLDENKLREREKHIKNKWKGTTWQECAKTISDKINEM